MKEFLDKLKVSSNKVNDIDYKFVSAREELTLKYFPYVISLDHEHL